MSGRSSSRTVTRVRETAERDVGTPLWFIILMAILVVIITISIIGVFATNNKIKKGAGYKSGTTHASTTTI